MVAIDVRQTEYAEASIENCARRMERLREEAGQTYKDLRYLSGMSVVRQRLSGCIDGMLEEKELLNQMAGCLVQTVRLCEERELAIAEYAEEAAVCTAGAVMEQWDIPQWVFQILGQEEENGNHIY